MIFGTINGSVVYSSSFETCIDLIYHYIFIFCKILYTCKIYIQSIDRQDQCISKTGNMIILSNICKDTSFE